MPALKVAVSLARLPAYRQFREVMHAEIPRQEVAHLYDQEKDEGQRKIFNDILASYDGQGLRVKHSQRRGGLGRFYADVGNVVGLKRRSKHTLLARQGWTDLDLKHSYPSIIMDVFEREKIELPAFRSMLNNRDAAYANTWKFYFGEQPYDKDTVKLLYSAFIFGGGFESWFEEVEKDGKFSLQTREREPFAKAFKTDCAKVIDTVYEKNGDMVKLLCPEDSAETKAMQLHEKKNRVMSYWAGVFENDILHAAYVWLAERGFLQRNKNVLLEYDGLIFKPLRAFEEGDADALTMHVRRSLGYSRVRFEAKAFDRNCPELFAGYSMKDGDEKKRSAKYEDMKREFERTHAKMMNNGTYCRLKEDGQPEFFGETTFTTIYRHLRTVVRDENTGKEKEVGFIGMWMHDPEIKTYVGTTICEPGEEPEGLLNLWVPFRMERESAKFSEDFDEEEMQRDAALLMKTLRGLCAKDDESTVEFLVDWLAHLVAFPFEKSKVPVIISGEGAGKNSLNLFIVRLMGSDKVASSANMDAYLGKYNDLLAGKSLLVLNEVEKVDMARYLPILKELISEPYMTISKKHVPSYILPCLLRMMIFTNRENVHASTMGDRRFIVIRACDCNIGDKAHFDAFYELIDDSRRMYAMYQYLLWHAKAKNVPANFLSRDIKPTEYQKVIQNENVCPFIGFMRDYFARCDGLPEVREKASTLYSLFSQWSRENGFKTIQTSTAFGTSLGQMKGVAKKRTTAGQFYVFAMDEIEPKYIDQTERE